MIVWITRAQLETLSSGPGGTATVHHAQGEVPSSELVCCHLNPTEELAARRQQRNPLTSPSEYEELPRDEVIPIIAREGRETADALDRLTLAVQGHANILNVRPEMLPVYLGLAHAALLAGGENRWSQEQLADMLPRPLRTAVRVASPETGAQQSLAHEYTERMSRQYDETMTRRLQRLGGEEVVDSRPPEAHTRSPRRVIRDVDTSAAGMPDF